MITEKWIGLTMCNKKKEGREIQKSEKGKW